MPAPKIGADAAIAKLNGWSAVEGRDAIKLLGGKAKVPPAARLFCLYGADGTPVSISDSRDGAIGSAFEHELMPMSVH